MARNSKNKTKKKRVEKDAAPPAPRLQGAPSSRPDSMSQPSEAGKERRQDTPIVTHASPTSSWRAEQNLLLRDELPDGDAPPAPSDEGVTGACSGSSGRPTDDGWETVAYKRSGRRSSKPVQPQALIKSAAPHNARRFRKPATLAQYHVPVPVPATSTQAQHAQIAEEEDIPYIGALFEEKEEGDSEEERHALYLKHSSKCSKDHMVCLICYLEFGKPKPINRSKVQDHCQEIHKTPGIKCEQKGCQVRGRCKGDTGKHKRYSHDLGAGWRQKLD
ncbi:uncharacterized protein LOC107305299 [Oryza brachyantha]|uniref:uncharacterized protein LOC107305299 n=1 Tax=Oryza brachyantha TaxID=4533 RepID=UPI0007769552|nr:uncharacterized protein LOC107305299 [Oryza brachyantha]